MPITKEIILEISNGGINLPAEEIKQSLFLDDNDNKGDEI